MSTTEKTTFKHFIIRIPRVYARPETHLNLEPFLFSSIPAVRTAEVMNGHELENVSATIYDACKVLTVYTSLDVLTELVRMCCIYDAKKQINWVATLSLISDTLLDCNPNRDLIELHYPAPFVKEYIEKLYGVIAANLVQVEA